MKILNFLPAIVATFGWLSFSASARADGPCHGWGWNGGGWHGGWNGGWHGGYWRGNYWHGGGWHGAYWHGGPVIGIGIYPGAYYGPYYAYGPYYR